MTVSWNSRDCRAKIGANPKEPPHLSMMACNQALPLSTYGRQELKLRSIGSPGKPCRNDAIVRGPTVGLSCS